MSSLTRSWTTMSFCSRSPICSNQDVLVSCTFKEMFDSSTCTNHLVAIAIVTPLTLVLVLRLLVGFRKSVTPARQLFTLRSPLQLAAVVSNGCLGLVHLVLGLWMLGGNQVASVCLPSLCLVTLSQGFSLVLAAFALAIRHGFLGVAFARFWSVSLTIYAAFICGSSVLSAVAAKAVTIKACLDFLSLPGAVIILLYSFQSIHDEVGHEGNGKGLYEPLKADTDRDVADSSEVTAFAKAGILSEMSFWWLNPFMKMGYEKPLEEEDMPLLGATDRAQNQYLVFLEKLNRNKKHSSDTAPSILWTIVSHHKRGIMVSALFALLKVLTLSTGPLLLRAFINVSVGKGTYKHEGLMLAAIIFICKCCESLSQRQWYFRTRRLGLQVRSLLSAAIYRKQQKLSSSAKMKHSSGQIMNYVTVDAYRVGEFPYWFHQTWTTIVQLCIALAILYNAVGAAMVSSLVVVIITVLCNAPLAKLQHKFQSKLMEAQDVRLKAMTESLVHMILKLYAWEAHFKKAIEKLREVEYKWLSAFQLSRAYNSVLFWSSPVWVSAVTFLTCYLLEIPLDASNVFTFIATLRLVQDPIRSIPEVLGVVVQAKVAFTRIEKFLGAPELNGQVKRKYHMGISCPVAMNSCRFSWYEDPSKPTLKNINLVIQAGEKIAICGEVGSGKSTLLAAMLGEVPKTEGTIQVCGKIAYVSQNAWIQTGTVQENILFGSCMDIQRYQETLLRCSLVKDLEMLPYGDNTQIGERGVNLSGGQKQRLQLARALYQNADIYLLDDPFSAVDAHTATSLFHEYVMCALSDKTVVLVTHQVDFLPVFDTILLMSDGEVIQSAPYQELFADCQEFKDLVNAHKDTIGLSDLNNSIAPHRANEISIKVKDHNYGNQYKKSGKPSPANQLIKKEEKETGDTGVKPYMLYFCQNKGFMYASLCVISHMIFIAGQIAQNSWMAANVQNPNISTLKLITVYIVIGVCTMFFLLSRCLSVVVLGVQTSRSLFSQLLDSLFRAPMSFYDSTPLGRVLSRVSSDLSTVDLDVPFAFMFSLSASINGYSNLGVLAVVTWQVLFVSVPMIVLAIRLQRYYLATAKELMRINGTTKSDLANHLGESISGAITIRAFEEEDRFFVKNSDLVDKNAIPYFYNFAATEWLIQRLEMMSAGVLSFSAFLMVLPPGTFSPGIVGMILSYGLSLNMSFVSSIRKQCNFANQIISVERVNQYMDIQSEAPEFINENRPAPDWPQIGSVELIDLKIRYRKDAPLVLHGISCKFEGGDKIGIVGRKGSGKTTLIGALFRLTEPAGGRIIIDSLDITRIGVYDLRSRLGIIPQDPTLFQGTVRYNLDPLGQFSDHQIWEVLDKCQLLEAVQEKEHGLDSLVAEDGSNWSMGQRQLFCLGRTLLRRCRILVLDEATASIDNGTDVILQRTIRREFKYCTVITVAHRIPTVMESDMVLAMSDGRVAEYDKPTKLMETEGSLFGELVREYCSYTSNGNT